MNEITPADKETARRPSSRSSTFEPGPCEGRQEPLAETFVFRCTAAEKAQLRAKAEVAGLPAATLLREALAPNETQQAEVIDAFERLSFAGLDPEQYDML